jgi:hypothetical protein
MGTRWGLQRLGVSPSLRWTGMSLVLDFLSAYFDSYAGISIALDTYHGTKQLLSDDQDDA